MASPGIDKQRKNIFEYAFNIVTNKPMAKRIFNSSVQPVANARRVVQSDSPLGAATSKFGVKIATTAINSAAKRAPAPMVGELVGKLTGSLESWWRAERRKSQLARHKAAGDDLETLKFQIKDFSLGALDSHRQKLEVAARELSAQSIAFTSKSPQYFAEKRVCDGHVKNFTALFQLIRRHNKMAESVNECEALMAAIKSRLRDVQRSIDFAEGYYWSAFDEDMAKAEKEPDLHQACEHCTLASIPLTISQKVAAGISSNKVFSKLIVPTLGGYANDLAYAKEGEAVQKGTVSSPLS